MTDELTVGQVAARFGVTVRTLHHYDAIGLVRPSERGWNGYRLYTPADVQRLARVVLPAGVDRCPTFVRLHEECAAHSSCRCAEVVQLKTAIASGR